jgi:hypothetical protein
MPQFLACISAALLLVTASNSEKNLTRTSPEAVPSFASLSAQQRTQLPDNTRVTVGKYTVTLGALRASHQARAMHILTAAGAGGAAGQAASSAKEVRMSLNATLRAVLLSNPVIEPAKEFADNALDMQKFCNAAQAAVCLYYPASTTLFQGGGWAGEIDPYITDPSICTSQGGLHLAGGCQYNYDTYYHAQFNPGSGFTYKAACDAKYWKVTTVDKHGAIVVDSVIPQGTTFTTGGAPSSCVIRAWVRP